ncbi:MAG: NAD(P)H-hydrate dehydratase, partial [Bacteroides sp.]|nr:NAD(P)H-hydrate dehydratase [Bacteroides sp.]
LDADALNFIGRNKNSIKNIPYDTILTPHPKELDRIIGNCTNSYSRLSQATDLAQATRSYIVLKGAYTTIITPDGNCYFNPTGNPGMATGGSGDILTGIILALLAQGYSSFDASLIGTYVHGLAGDLAKENKGEIGMTAQDIVDYLPLAWKEIAQ